MEKTAISAAEAVMDALEAFETETGRGLQEGEDFVTIFDNIVILISMVDGVVHTDIFLHPLRVNKTYSFEDLENEMEMEAESGCLN